MSNENIDIIRLKIDAEADFLANSIQGQWGYVVDTKRIVVHDNDADTITCGISDDSLQLLLAGAQTVTGAKTFSADVTLNSFVDLKLATDGEIYGDGDGRVFLKGGTNVRVDAEGGDLELRAQDAIEFGDTTDNPNYEFKGTGAMTLGGTLAVTTAITVAGAAPTITLTDSGSDPTDVTIDFDTDIFTIAYNASNYIKLRDDHVALYSGFLDFRGDMTVDGDSEFQGNVLMEGNYQIRFNDTNSYIGDAVPNGVSGLVISDTTRINVSSPSIYIGDGSTANIPVVYSGSADGKIQWQSVEGYFNFYDDILMRLSKKLYFSDTAHYINYDGTAGMDMVSDDQIHIEAADDLYIGDLTNNPDTNFIGSGIVSHYGELWMRNDVILSIGHDGDPAKLQYVSASDQLDLEIPSASTTSLVIHDGTSNYLEIDTTNNEISFGNATDNTDFVFLGTGDVTMGGDLSIAGQFLTASVYHAHGGFQGEAETIAVATQNTYVPITNATTDLFTQLDGEGITLSGDVWTIVNAGDYEGVLSMTISGLNGKDFHIRLYNITQETAVGYYMGGTTTGATNIMDITLPLYIDADAGDTFRFEITCTTDASDPIVESAIYVIKYLHS